MKTIPHTITKEEVVKMLEAKNYQYGELSNKYAELKYKLQRLEEKLKITQKTGREK